MLSSFAVLGILLAGSRVRGRDTEKQLEERIRTEHNPVKKAKDEIKLADLKLADAVGAYNSGDTQLGAKLVETFVEQMRSAWKTLQESGRKASKEPAGFKELDISLREDLRSLDDLGHKVSYFDRDPLLKAAQETDRLRSEVLQELFPANKPPPKKPSAAPQ